MAKRRSLNRRSSKSGRFSSRSSIGSNILNPDSNFLEDERPFWWNLSSIGSAIEIPPVNETSTVLNPDSQLQSTEEEEWWKHLHTSAPNIPSTSKGISRTSVIPKTDNSAHVSNTSTSESEGDHKKVKKKKVPLRKTTHRSRESNAFLNALNESGNSIQSEPSKLKDLNGSLNNSLSMKTTDKQKRRSKNQDISLDNTYDNVIKRKAVLRKKRQSKGLNVFDEILSQENTSVSRSPGKSRKSLQDNLVDGQLDQSKGVYKEVSVKLTDIRNSPQSPKINEQSKRTSNERTYIESTDESDNVEFAKPKSRFLRRHRQSSSKNIFQDILTNEENVDLNEKSVESNTRNKSTGKEELDETLVDAKADSHVDTKIRRSKRSKERSTNMSKSLSATSFQETGAYEGNSDLNNDSNSKGLDSVVPPTQEAVNDNDSNSKGLDSVVPPTQEAANESIGSRRSLPAKSRNTSLSKSVSEKPENQEQAKSRSVESPEIQHADDGIDSADKSSSNHSSKKKTNTVQSRRSVTTKLMKTTNSSSGSTDGSLFAAKKIDKTAKSRRSKNEIMDTSKISNSKGHNNKDTSDNIQLQFSGSEESDIIQPVRMNQSLAQKTLESELSLSTLKNLNAAAASTPIVLSKRMSRKTLRRSNRIAVSADSPKKDAPMNKTNAVALESIHENYNEVDEAEISRRSEKRKSSSSLSENSSKRVKTIKNRNTENEDPAQDKLSTSRGKLRKSSIKTAVVSDSDAEGLATKSVHWDKQDAKRSSRRTNTSLRSRNSLSRIVSEEGEEESLSDENLPHPVEASISRRKSRSQVAVVEEGENEDDANEVSSSSRDVRQSTGRTRNPSRILDDEEKEDVEVAAPSFVIPTSRNTSTIEVAPERISMNVGNNSRNDIINDENHSVSFQPVETSLNETQERSSPRRRNVASLSTSKTEKVEAPVEKRRTVPRVSENPKRRSMFPHIDAVANSPAASTSKNQRTIGDFFKVRSPTKSVLQASSMGILSSSQTFADKQKVEDVRKKLEEVKKRNLAELEANLNRQKKVMALMAQKPKLARKPAAKKSPTEIDKAFIVNGQVYKRPKLPRPKPWVTDRLYKYLWKCMEPKYGLATRARSEKFVLGLSEVVTIVRRRKKYENYKDELDALMREMARLGIIRTPKDFYDFSYDFLPCEFHEKAVPMIRPGNLQNIPYDPRRAFEPILPD